jgi:hypothetical protein
MSWLIVSPGSGDSLSRYPVQGRAKVLSDKNGGVTEGQATAARPLRLMQQVRERLRVRHYSPRTEQACVGWIRRFIRANGRRHPRELGGAEVGAFLTVLATHSRVASTTQIFTHVLGRDASAVRSPLDR